MPSAPRARASSRCRAKASQLGCASAGTQTQRQIGADLHRAGMRARHSLFEKRTSLPLRLFAQIVAVFLEQVISDQRHWPVAQHFWREKLAPETLLQFRKGAQIAKVVHRGTRVRTGRDDDELAVEDNIVGEKIDERGKLRKAVADKLLAARP